MHPRVLSLASQFTLSFYDNTIPSPERLYDLMNLIWVYLSGLSACIAGTEHKVTDECFGFDILHRPISPLTCKPQLIRNIFLAILHYL